MHWGHLLLKDSDDEQSNFAAKIKNLWKSEKNNWKTFFLKNNLGLLFTTRKKILSTLKVDYFELKI